MELRPIILAAGRGSRMYPLTEGCPKALLPVGNVPLVWYPVHWLEKNGYAKVTVVVSESSSQQINDALTELCISNSSKILLSFEEIPDSEDSGTADTLRNLKIKGDLLVITCDLVATVPLHWLTDSHHTKNSTLTLLLVHPSQDEEDPSKKKQLGATDRDIIGLDDQSHLVYFMASADLDEGLPLSKSLLNRHPHIKFTSQLLDAHVYLMDRWASEQLHTKCRSMSSIKRELIPHLVRLQNHTSLNSTTNLDESSTNKQEEPQSTDDALEKMALQRSSFAGVDGGSKNFIRQQLRCNAVVVPSDGGLCTRVNSLQQYITINRMMYQYADHFGFLKKTDAATSRGKSVNPDCLVATATQVSDKASVKRSCLGQHCVISDKCKIIGSVLMDYVTVGEGCSIQNCVICSHVRIEDGANLKDCYIGANYTVIKDADLRGETLVAGGGLHI
ncbi:hypothetical protein EMCRGX_G018866 [Ephydatia muelleri]